MKCKHCNYEMEAEFVDIGIGTQQVTDWQCTNDHCPKYLEWLEQNCKREDWCTVRTALNQYSGIGGSKLNKNQIGDVEHALRNGNRFYTDANNKDWNDLVEKGYANKHGGWEESMAYYKITAEGKKALKIATA